MREIILPALVAGTALAGFMGIQATQSVAQVDNTSSAAVTTPANSSSNAKASPSPIVVELFTSQGCSSCPPADMLASRLAKDSTLLVITRPVTYWDRLGWKDTLARQENTSLQRAYANKGNTGSGVYTPQIVINGGGGAVGSRESDVRSLVRLSKGQAGPSIFADQAADGSMTIKIDGRSQHMAGVSLLALSSSETVRVGRGENGGRTLHYTNVVRNERNLGGWNGRPMTITVPVENLSIEGADKYAVVVQRPGSGTIVAAKLLDI